MLTFHTLLEGISLVSRETDTGGNVVDNRAGGLSAAGPGTRINTLTSRAGLLSATVRVDQALRPAASLGITQQSRSTGTTANTSRRCGSSSRATLGGLTDVLLSWGRS